MAALLIPRRDRTDQKFESTTLSSTHTTYLVHRDGFIQKRGLNIWLMNTLRGAGLKKW